MRMTSKAAFRSPASSTERNTKSRVAGPIGPCISITSTRCSATRSVSSPACWPNAPAANTTAMIKISTVRRMLMISSHFHLLRWGKHCSMSINWRLGLQRLHGRSSWLCRRKLGRERCSGRFCVRPNVEMLGFSETGQFRHSF